MASELAGPTRRAEPTEQRLVSSDPIRSAAVTLGPSLLLDLALGAGLVGGARAAFDARGRGRRLIRLAGIAAGAVGLFALRRWELRWGATDAEVRAELPGDALIERPVWRSTRAITIEAPPAEVWPWLVQMGQGRGGLYSFDCLENLAGLDIHSVDRVVPELQQLAVGDPIPLAPGDRSMVVARLEPEHALVLQVADPRTGVALDVSAEGVEMAGSWAFVVKPAHDGRTRLLHRFRFGARHRVLGALGYALLVEVPHFVMEWRMMLGIKRRAERRAAAPA